MVGIPRFLQFPRATYDAFTVILLITQEEKPSFVSSPIDPQGIASTLEALLLLQNIHGEINSCFSRTTVFQ